MSTNDRRDRQTSYAICSNWQGRHHTDCNNDNSGSFSSLKAAGNLILLNRVNFVIDDTDDAEDDIKDDTEDDAEDDTKDDAEDAWLWSRFMPRTHVDLSLIHI